MRFCGLTSLDSGQHGPSIQVANRQLPQHQGVDEAASASQLQRRSALGDAHAAAERRETSGLDFQDVVGGCEWKFRPAGPIGAGLDADRPMRRGHADLHI
jgi:hypothetical protein